MNALRNYTRWQEGLSGVLVADILGLGVDIMADPHAGTVLLFNRTLTPDEARLIGVRLIDAAVLADGSRAIRRAGTTDPGSAGNPAESAGRPGAQRRSTGGAS